MKKSCYFLWILWLLSNFAFSQGKFYVQNDKETDKIKFKLINNLVILPVEINGVTLSFLLDTGVSKPIVFNIFNISDSLKIKKTEKVFLRGLGEGEQIEAYKSEKNMFRVGDAINLNQDLYAIYNADLDFSSKLGFPVHGIIGFDLFKDLVVEINYAKQYLKLTNPSKYKYKVCRKCELLNLEFYNNKPFVAASIGKENDKTPVKLLIDTGGSDSLWLFESDSLGIKSDKAFFNDFLGHGLSGSVYGKRSKLDRFTIGSFNLETTNVAYPDSLFIVYAKKHTSRNGSISGNILKRFNLVFDYKNAIVMLKKNKYFKEPFYYNKSGIELHHNGLRLVREQDDKIDLEKSSMSRNNNASNSTRIIINPQYKLTLKPAYAIVELRENSAAYKAGLKINDIILTVNGKPAHQLTLQQVMAKFYDDDGKQIKLRVDRKGIILNFNFKLESPLIN